MKDQCTEATFLKDVAAHRMTVIRDDGVNRHIIFRKPDSGNMRFELITWPGYLCYTGDMGTYVFQRLEDMFQFFRMDRHCNLKEGTLYINRSYWGEKLEAICRSGGYKEYSESKFRERIAEWLAEEGADAELLQAVEDDVLWHADEGEDSAMRAALEFEHFGRHVFQDFGECSVTEYTYRFVWCCYALAWGIKQYDDNAALVSQEDICITGRDGIAYLHARGVKMTTRS